VGSKYPTAGKHGPRSILKKKRGSLPARCNIGPLRGHSASPSTSLQHMTQDNVVEQGRQIVRKKGWWTHVKKISSVPSRYVISPGQQAFKHRLLGRCFKCFAYDHRVAQCRDPTCCWVCKKWGHSSVACPRKRALGNVLPPPTLPFSLASALASSVRPSRASSSSVRLPTNQQTPMDSRRALGERSRNHPRWEPDGRIMENVVNFPSNPRFRPTIASKSATTSPEMDERRMMLSNHALTDRKPYYGVSTKTGVCKAMLRELPGCHSICVVFNKVYLK
jgi:hypothetical protein